MNTPYIQVSRGYCVSTKKRMKFGETGHGDNGSRRMFFVVNFTYIFYNAGGQLSFLNVPLNFSNSTLKKWNDTV